MTLLWIGAGLAGLLVLCAVAVEVHITMIDRRHRKHRERLEQQTRDAVQRLYGDPSLNVDVFPRQ